MGRERRSGGGTSRRRLAVMGPVAEKAGGRISGVSGREWNGGSASGTVRGRGHTRAELSTGTGHRGGGRGGEEMGGGEKDAGKRLRSYL